MPLVNARIRHIIAHELGSALGNREKAILASPTAFLTFNREMPPGFYKITDKSTGQTFTFSRVPPQIVG